MDEQNFSRSILAWYDAGHRDLPWRHTRDPYRIWVSEIMLQQTRAETVVGYYERFLRQFPTVQTLADADEQTLLKAWEGLGYYSRARSLQKAARVLVREHGGTLPGDVAALRALPGIGEYTAGAIAAIAFGLPVAAVDGNVERVLSRYDAVRACVGEPAVRRALRERAQALVPRDRPGAFANAMMELGATVCTPRRPACLLCPVQHTCQGFLQGIAAELPVKPAKKPPREQQRAVLLVLAQGRVLVMQRQERLLAGLYVFPDVEGTPDPAAMLAHLQALGVRAAYDGCAGQARHVFTHLVWAMTLHVFAAEDCAPVPDGQWVDAQALAALPMPTAVKVARACALERLRGLA